MINFNNINFLGTFRPYQQHVLDKSDNYLKNNKIHIVAAPGSGKTILGLELIRRLNSTCLVLSPTNTIKFQWGTRFEEMFLPKNKKVDNYVSFDLNNIKPITSITYQALHSAINKVECEDEDGEKIDFSNIDIFKTIEINNIKTICVDEAHHLQNEWQKALEKFMLGLGKDIKIIALTATPPYDATPIEWKRYINTCGEIDEEIFVTELVKANNLCPHQDYIYFNYPTAEESLDFKQHSEQVTQCFEKLTTLEFLNNLADIIFNKLAKKYVISEKENFIVIFKLLKYLNIFFDEKKASKLLLHKDFKTNLKDCETALNFLLSTDILSSTEKSKFVTILKKHNLIEQGKVKLILNSKLEKTITYSLGKLESISKIVSCEQNSLKDNLRMLVLTDYIRKKDQAKIGSTQSFKDISVVSVFETIRRSTTNTKLGILSGTLAILPTSLETKVRSLLTKKESLTCKPLANTHFSEYIFKISNKEKVKIVGQIFEDGDINILVGTKSLLGEGWDSPCINSLILASFVGSFMLSNQMRGRAIRVYKKDKNKTANIWHLVTLNPSSKNKNDINNFVLSDESSNDYKTLKRRFDCFVGPHYRINSIQNGISRISILKDKLSSNDVDEINNEMETRATNRTEMANSWFNTNSKTGQMYIESSIPKERIPKLPALFSLPNALICSMLLVLFAYITTRISNFVLFNISYFISCVLVTILCFYIYKITTLFSKKRFVKMVSLAILRSMMYLELLRLNGKIKVKNNFREKTIDVVLNNNIIKDQKNFHIALNEFFSYPENPRYILFKKFYKKLSFRYHFQVPKELSKNKNYINIFKTYLFLFKTFEFAYMKEKYYYKDKCKIHGFMKSNFKPIIQRQKEM